MTNQAEGSFFRFDSKSKMTWMQDRERTGLHDLLTRADCHGGENDIFFLCLKEKNILTRVERDDKTKKLYFLGMAFDAAQRHIWYYLPELIAVIVKMFQTSDYAAYFASEKSFSWNLEGEQTQEILRGARQREKALMQAVDLCVEENKDILEPHSVAFCSIEPKLYETDGIVFYPYAHKNSMKTLPVTFKRTKETALYLKPPKVFRAWTLTDKQDKIKISNIRESQSWNSLYQRIQTEWNADLFEQEE